MPLLSFMDKNEIIVVGFDIASINSGLVVVKVQLHDAGNLTTIVLHEQAFIAENNFHSRYQIGLAMVRVVRRVDYVQLCVVEDYINAVFSHVSFSLAELNGIVRCFLFSYGYSLMLNVPGRMRSFVTSAFTPPVKLQKGKKGKQDLILCVKELYNYQPQVGKGTSDCVDAFVHAVMGAIAYFLETGQYVDLTTKQSLLYHNEKGNGLLDDKKRWFVNKGELFGVK